MNLLSPEQCQDWCSRRGLRVSAAGYVSFPSGGFHSLVLKLPSNGLSAVGLSLVLARGFSDDASAALLWLKAWDVWSEDFEQIGVNLLRGARKPGGEDDGDLRKRPGQTFGPEDGLDLRTCLLVPLLFQWDAYLIPDHAGHVVFVCHDGFVNLLAKSERELDRIYSELEPWKPERRVPAKIRRFAE